MSTFKVVNIINKWGDKEKGMKNKKTQCKIKKKKHTQAKKQQPGHNLTWVN